jgi:hypothetical protein
MGVRVGAAVGEVSGAADSSGAVEEGGIDGAAEAQLAASRATAARVISDPGVKLRRMADLL